MQRLRRIAPVARARGLRVLLEAINRDDMPGYLLHDVRDAAALVRSIDDPGLGLQFDIYHVARTGLDPALELARSIDLVRHVQVADVPGRGEPGSGTIDFGACLDLLEAHGSNCHIGLEFRPTTDTEQALDSLRSVWGGRFLPAS